MTLPRRLTVRTRSGARPSTWFLTWLRSMEGVFRECFDNGVIIRTTGDTLAFSPPLIIEEGQIETVVETVRKALNNQ